MENLMETVSSVQVKITGKSVDEAVTQFMSWFEKNEAEIPDGMFSIIMPPASSGIYTITVTHRKK
jgi:hypothetical protein